MADAKMASSFIRLPSAFPPPVCRELELNLQAADNLKSREPLSEN